MAETAETEWEVSRKSKVSRKKLWQCSISHKSAHSPSDGEVEAK